MIEQETAGDEAPSGPSQRTVSIMLRGLGFILYSIKTLKSFQASKAFYFNYLNFTR